jgi:Protein of unknown function (DUF4242)
VHTYLVEHYEPGTSADDLSRSARDVRRAAAELAKEGRAVRYLRSTIVPGDEAFMAVFDAPSEELVREAYARAGVSFDRITRAIQQEIEREEQR